MGLEPGCPLRAIPGPRVGPKARPGIGSGRGPATGGAGRGEVVDLRAKPGDDTEGGL